MRFRERIECQQFKGIFFAQNIWGRVWGFFYVKRWPPSCMLTFGLVWGFSVTIKSIPNLWICRQCLIPYILSRFPFENLHISYNNLFGMLPPSLLVVTNAKGNPNLYDVANKCEAKDNKQITSWMEWCCRQRYCKRLWCWKPRGPETTVVNV
jgi:hypothetical protein